MVHRIIEFEIRARRPRSVYLAGLLLVGKFGLSLWAAYVWIQAGQIVPGLCLLLARPI